MSNLLDLLVTEQPNERTRHIDRLSSLEIVRLMNEEDQGVAMAIQGLLPLVADAVDRIVDSFRRGGRLIYVGAGTSGRLGILDASECPPTFGTPPSKVLGLIAGGFQAVKDPVEGAEDREEQGAADIDSEAVDERDTVVGIAASGRTPYVLGAMKRARALGATVIGVCNNPDVPMSACADLVLEAVVGPEVVLGSTRLKAGTAQKMILNMLTTASMIRIGKVYGNLMVDLQASNQKLVHRAKRIIAMATEAPGEQIDAAFEAAGGNVKTAIVMLLTGSDAQAAASALRDADGFVRPALDAAKRKE